MLHFFILKLSDFLTHKSVYIITMIRYTVYLFFYIIKRTVLCTVLF